MWPLWARSANPYITRLRTTMIVESVWKELKHTHLRSHARPRLDLVTHIVLTNFLPVALNKLDFITGERRLGRVVPLSSWKKAFKHQWDDMLRPDEYQTTKRELRVLKTSANTLHTKKRRAEQLEWI
jgi:retron-type reverse transcriptase